MAVLVCILLCSAVRRYAVAYALESNQRMTVRSSKSAPRLAALEGKESPGSATGVSLIDPKKSQTKLSRIQGEKALSSRGQGRSPETGRRMTTPADGINQLHLDVCQYPCMGTKLCCPQPCQQTVDLLPTSSLVLVN